jgi:uncharacterized protein (DUF697 family)
MTARKDPRGPINTVATSILDLVAHVPNSHEARVPAPTERANDIARAAARQASMIAGSLSLPPGWLGWITVLPEMLAVWKIQAQMVADIAGVYGQHHRLRREHLLYCLFKQVSAQLFRDMAVRMGERVVVRPATGKALHLIAQQLGGQLAGLALRKGASRFVPLLGALGVGAYAYYDTRQVANNALALFGGKPSGTEDQSDVLDAAETVVSVDTEKIPKNHEK